MELKEYQVKALDAFTRWRDALDEARRECLKDTEYYRSQNRPIPPDVSNYPQTTWRKLGDEGWLPANAGEHIDQHRQSGPPGASRLPQGAHRRGMTLSIIFASCC